MISKTENNQSISIDKINNELKKIIEKKRNMWNGLISTPWDHVPDDCEAIKIFSDGSWISYGNPECRGIWKKCPAKLLPLKGKKFIVHFRP